MRGVVEIYSDNKLLYQEDNLLVNGAGELLADIMTVSRSLSGVADLATSSILDASNYTIQAISFGTGANAYKDNAHRANSAKIDLLSGTFMTSAVIAVYHQHEPTLSLASTASSYSPCSVLPHYPDPAMSSLEVSSTLSAVLVTPGYLADVPVSSIPLSAIILGNGQNLNLMPSAYQNAAFLNTDLSSLSSVAGALFGCWPDGSALGGTNFSGFTMGSTYGVDDVVYSGVYNGIFNAASSMDTSGFVNMVMSGAPGTTAEYLMSSTFSGLCVSGGNQSDSSGTVEYSVTLGAGDVGAANLYGGLYNMGLWTIDMKKSLLAGNTPPYGFDPLNNPRKYKLFSMKSFTKNLTRIKDSGENAGCINYKDLLIKWRIHFL